VSISKNCFWLGSIKFAELANGAAAWATASGAAVLISGVLMTGFACGAELRRPVFAKATWCLTDDHSMKPVINIATSAVQQIMGIVVGFIFCED
jgi:hypothetical protein